MLNGLTANGESFSYLNDNASLKEMVENLYQFPYGSSEYNVILRALRAKHLHGNKYKEIVIAFPSYLDQQIKQDEESTLYYLNNIRGVRKLSSFDFTEFYEDSATHHVNDFGEFFSGETTFMEDNTFEMLQRAHVEYNPGFKQLVTSLYIKDANDNFIFLRTKPEGDNRIHDKVTFVQGHLSFDSQAYLMDQASFIRRNMEKELSEEIISSVELEVPKAPKFLINDRSNHIGLEHFGIIYEMTVTSAQELFDKLETGESSKHDVVLMSKEEIIYHQDTLDNWVQMILTELNVLG